MIKSLESDTIAHKLISPARSRISTMRHLAVMARVEAADAAKDFPTLLDNVSAIRGEVPETCINPSQLPQLMAKTYLNTCVLATHESSVYVRDKA